MSATDRRRLRLARCLRASVTPPNKDASARRSFPPWVMILDKPTLVHDESKSRARSPQSGHSRGRTSGSSWRWHTDGRGERALRGRLQPLGPFEQAFAGSRGLDLDRRATGGGREGPVAEAPPPTCGSVSRLGASKSERASSGRRSQWRTPRARSASSPGDAPRSRSSRARSARLLVIRQPCHYRS
jgi:hypothetical protein